MTLRSSPKAAAAAANRPPVCCGSSVRPRPENRRFLCRPGCLLHLRSLAAKMNQISSSHEMCRSVLWAAIWENTSAALMSFLFLRA
jgi:hypothetical protein